MDFAFTPEQEALRREVRAFIASEVTPEVIAEMEEHNEGRPFHRTACRSPLLSALFKKIADRGWVGISYPKEYGGQGGDRITQYIVEEELYRANLTIALGGSGAPAIMAAGTEEQKRYYIPKLITGEFMFAQGFTEPRGGADLASLQCRADRDGDDYVINGQKIYTSNAESATHIYLMARTNRNVPKHEGISIFLVPMDTPGITIRPLWTIQNEPRAALTTTYGHARTNETFYDNVRVHKSCLLGEENKGWRVGSMGLNLDRVGAARYLISVRRDEDIINWIKASRELGDYSPANDAAIRDKVAELWTEAQVCRLMTMRSMSIVERGGKFTYEGSAEKVWAPEHGVRTTEAITQMLGPYGQLLNGSPRAIRNGLFAHNLMGAFQSGINHGSVQVMRDQVARRGLAMPRAKR
ncbi:MAG: acyl-CoA dehydrogenase family protein [Betaproteobacteria bacterium]|nr:acyl-CoA dehydrogenase family protein [Betaproteobacteria bacterium]